MPIKLLIADDHQMVIDGLVSVLKEENELELLKPVNNGQELLREVRRSSPDVILLDLNMPRLDGIETLTILNKDFPQIKVLILSSYNHPELIEEVKKLGAKGYLIKDTPYPFLRQSILNVAEGINWVQNIDNSVSNTPSYYIDDFMKKYQLSKREVEIVGMIAKGCTSKEIGDNLFISEFTVTTHRRNILRKLNIKSVATLVLFAKENGLVI